MFKRFTNGCVQVVNRWLPDPFLFAIILTIVVFIAAMIGTQQGPLELVWSWGGQGESRMASGACCPSPCRWPWCWCWAPPWPPPRRARRRWQRLPPGSRQKERNPGYHLRVHHLLLAQLGLWPDCRRPAGQGCGPPGTGCGLSPADCLRLFRLVIWHAGLSGSIPLQIGGTGSGCLELYTRPRLLPLYFTR